MTRLTIAILLPLIAIEACSRPHGTRTGVGGFSECKGLPAVGEGAITGTILWDSSGAPAIERAVDLNDTLCIAITDSLGRFQFAGLPPGDYVVTVATLGARSLASLKVHVALDNKPTLNIRLLPPNDVLDCLDVPQCAPLLAVPESAQLATLKGADQLAEVALRTAIAMTNPRIQVPSPPAMCLDLRRLRDSVTVPPSAAVLAILGSRYDDVHQRADCEASNSTWHLRLRGQESRAWHVVAEMPRLTSDSTGIGSTEYYVAPLWAAAWTCTYERHLGVWRPVRCVMEWIS